MIFVQPSIARVITGIIRRLMPGPVNEFSRWPAGARDAAWELFLVSQIKLITFMFYIIGTLTFYYIY